MNVKTNIQDQIFHDPIFLIPVPIRILILTEDEGSFSPQHRFSLTEVIGALRTLDSYTVQFKITTAHRLMDTEDDPSNPAPGLNNFAKDADIKGFRFDNPAQFNPKNFDEVWLFGISTGHGDYFPVHPLSDRELRILTQFMNSGGGVFATGDHEDLGKPLCGRIPRVRSMRKWEFDYQRAENEGYDQFIPSPTDAPPVFGKYRHDTLVAGPDKTFEFDDQSDDIPAPLDPVFYQFSTYVERGSYPHPLLCTPMGTLDILPDHMHEGHIVKPARLDDTYSFDGYSGDEYPKDEFGGRVSPLVVAYIEALGGHKTRTEKKDTFGGQGNEPVNFPDLAVVDEVYGAIGAYDGHYAGVGRVAVDSTFHHFFNINLDGAGSNTNLHGFLSSAEGQQHYEKIKHYYRNIGLWLAPKAVQDLVFQRALWAARWDSQLKMQAPGERNMQGWSDIVVYGRSVQAALYRLHPPCYVRGWTLAAIDPKALLLSHEVYVDLNRPDPPPWDSRQLLLNVEDLLAAALAGMMNEIKRAAPMRTLEARRMAEKELPGIISRGATMGIRQALSFYRSALANTERFLGMVSGGQ